MIERQFPGVGMKNAPGDCRPNWIAGQRRNGSPPMKPQRSREDDRAVVTVPVELLPEIRRLLARYKSA